MAKPAQSHYLLLYLTSCEKGRLMAMLPAPLTETDSATSRQARQHGLLLRLIDDQRIAFVIVGTMNTALGVLWFVFFHVTVGDQVGYMVTLLLAHVAAVLCAFMLHRRVVFKVRGHFWLDLARFELVNISVLLFNAALLPITVELAGVRVLPAQLLVTGVTVVLSFFAHRGFSFHRRAK